ncbi:MAG: protein kinase [Sedimentisphaerales bacterium]|nr:protein kinase [Sedimentisphaerales bacterium]
MDNANHVRPRHVSAAPKVTMDLSADKGSLPTAPFPKEGCKTQLGRYELLLEMGHGGMATLFLARLSGPKQFEKLVAIKKIHDHLAKEENFVNMFLDEARIAALIDHPNVATIFDMGEVKGTYYLAMEYVHGQTLADIMKAATRRRDAFPWRFACRIVADAAAGLHAAHQLRSKDGRPLHVVHRDISPQNILLSYDGHVKVVDFGVAYAAEKLVETSAGTLKGKVAYMSPEQTRGEKLTFHSDIFSLGVVLYEAVCLQRLFKAANEAATIMNVREATVPDPREFNPHIPQRLVDVIRTALAADPDRRFGSAEEMSEHLNSVLTASDSSVIRHDLSSMVTGLFHDRKLLKDREIKEALENRHSPTVRAIAVVREVESSLSAAPTLADPIRKRIARRKRLLAPVLVSGFVVSLAVVFVFLILPLLTARPAGRRSPGEPRKETQNPSAQAPQGTPGDHPASTGKAPPAAGPVTLKITVSPPDAPVRVSFRGQKYEGGVFKAVVARSERPERITIEAEGFQSDALVVVPTQDSDLKVTLKPLPRKSRPRPVVTGPSSRKPRPGITVTRPESRKERPRPGRGPSLPPLRDPFRGGPTR